MHTMAYIYEHNGIYAHNDIYAHYFVLGMGYIPGIYASIYFTQRKLDYM